MIEAIKKRKSVRTYEKQTLTDEDERKIEKLIKDIKTLKGPFGNRVKLHLFNRPFSDQNESKKIGTYGFVKNAQAFIAGSVINTFEGLIDFGYLFEYLILKLTSYDLATVWLGGTFNRKDFEYLLEENEVIPAITPVGYIAKNMSIKENMIRTTIKANQRKPFKTLFFNQNLETPLDEHHLYAPMLEMVRIGQSASNKQPWRAIVDEHMIHFYLERTPKYAEGLSIDIQAVDLGIAVSHFCLALEANQINYHIDTKNRIDQKNHLIWILSVKVDHSK
ncbi:MAG: hypothetical protein JXC31_00330 [Acholeplasmataceae bacterium]|nr:hypothetical protein [Acholeplasmataceae bacterium]